MEIGFVAVERPSSEKEMHRYERQRAAFAATNTVVGVAAAVVELLAVADTAFVAAVVHYSNYS